MSSFEPQANLHDDSQSIVLKVMLYSGFSAHYRGLHKSWIINIEGFVTAFLSDDLPRSINVHCSLSLDD